MPRATRLNASLAVAFLAAGSAACGGSHPPALIDAGGNSSVTGSGGTSGGVNGATTSSALTSGGSPSTSGASMTSGTSGLTSGATSGGPGGASTSGSSATTGGQTTGGSTGGPPTSGDATITGGATGSGTGTGGGPGTGTGGSTGNGDEGAVPCNWVGSTCVPDCRYAHVGTQCALNGGGLGVCDGQSCVAVDLLNDSSNCGQIGLACPSGYQCSNGACSVTDCTGVTGCPSGTVCVYNLGCVLIDCSSAQDDDYCAGPGFCCSGTCLQATASDSSNCGGCGVQCPAGTFCDYGACVPQAQCTANQNTSAELCEISTGVPGTCCQGKCVDLAADPNNCGACGYACCHGTTCGSQACFGDCADDGGCSDGYAWSWQSRSCLTTQCGPNDEGLPCTDPATGQFLFCCDGICASTAANCGGCGIGCPSGTQCVNDFYCVSSDCSTGVTCALDGGYATCCAGQCMDVSSDNANCGSCGRPCPLGAHCYSGYCYDNSGNPTSCQSDSDCPSGTVCADGTCANVGCDAGNSVCALGGDTGSGTCCEGVCSSTIRGTPASCASCGLRCPSGFNCQAGSGICFDANGGTPPCTADSCFAGELCLGYYGCVPPTCGPGREGNYCALSSTPYGFLGTCCNGACVDDYSDPKNCGACGNTCPSNLCFEGRCLPGTDGGQCLQTCGSGTLCAGADCVGSTCASSQTYCLAQDGQLGLCCGAGCVDIASDAFNCGICNLSCASGTTCQNGLCNGDSACGAGHVGYNCDLDAGFSFRCCPGLGCIDTSTDSQNCGGCGLTCGASQSCDAGVCG